MATPTAFTLNSVTTTSVTITVTNFGNNGEAGGAYREGSSDNEYRIIFINVTDNEETYIYDAPQDFFTLNVPKTILYSDEVWNVDPLVLVNNNITVELSNQTITSIPGSAAMPGTATNSTPVRTAFTLNSVTTTALTITITEFGNDDNNRFGSTADVYNVDFTQANATVRAFTAPRNYFTINTAKEILFSDGDWNQAPVVSTNDVISVVVSNDSKNTIVGSTVEQGTVTGGGGGGVPCFVASSQLLTPTGYCAAKDIKTGDILMTADGRQVSVKAFSFTVEVADKESAPFFISKNSISIGCPNADLHLSPWHAFQMKKGLWMKPMSALELGMSVQQYDLGKPVTYYHFEAPNYFKDNFICEGTVVESFGGVQIKGMKGRVYTYSSSLKGYTRVAAKPVSKAVMM